MGIPSGLILIWSGSFATIPAGYVLCNGANGTPDLRNRFIVGAGSTYPVDATGGTVFHNHSFTGDGHTHLFGAGANIQAGTNYRNPTELGAGGGNTDNALSLPPYYALFYIMKT